MNAVLQYIVWHLGITAQNWPLYAAAVVFGAVLGVASAKARASDHQ